MLLAGPARAQRGPLVTEDPRPLPAGRVLVEAGVEALAGRAYPLSGLDGTLLTVPALRFRIGFGRAELSLTGGYDLLFVDDRDPSAPLAGELDLDGDVTRDIHDPVVATKVLLWHETARAPAVGVRFATRLPSAGNASGLGNDATDVFLALLAGKSWGRTRAIGSFGMGVLAIPTRGDRQNDVLTYGAAVTRQAGSRVDLVAEAHGRVDVKGDTPAGTEDLGQARLGARWEAARRGAEEADGRRLDLWGAVVVGLADADADVGLALGASYGFRGFEE